MNLEKLKQMDEQNEKSRKEYRDTKMNSPIKNWETKLNSTEFEDKLQEELEQELNYGKRLSIRFTIAYEIGRYEYNSFISLYGRFVSRSNYIMGVTLHSDYNYNGDEVEEIAKSMYEMLKNKLTELGFVITKEDGELEVRYNDESKITLYLKVR